MSDQSTESELLPEPLPCPFCRFARVELIRDSNASYVYCDNCGAKGPGCTWKDIRDSRAITEWNFALRIRQ